MPATARVLIVDDSRIFRNALEASLADEGDVAVVGSVFNGQKALEFVQATPPDVVTLDVEMPGMDGLETLRAIQRFNAGRSADSAVGVIMVSSHTKRGADITIQALRDGAFDFIAKPSGPDHDRNLQQLRQQLLAKIRLFLLSRRPPGTVSAGEEPLAVPQAPPASPGHRLQWLRAVSRRSVRALVIAASTGGPKALEHLLPGLRHHTDLPILVVQHMPADFTRSLAESLAKLSQGSVVEARDGQAIQSATTYIAPGGKHLVVRRERGQAVIGTNEQPPENGCRPSADILFRSAAAAWRSDLIAIVLTGMGRDGTAGLGTVKRAGGYVVAQDEASSVVWGMPGSAVEAGVVDEVVPLAGIADAVGQLVAGKGRS
ncbi:MAG: chemotaxis response regulator protein-glutamate methylesterase [Pirellulaceae bacterium]|nr:chemotaxis response regulator protein-glutamate methylesterase [Pirellulaceae bacterium]